ncbi:uncharacterized protein EV420DRAFT_1508766 [Desarmillaria tabescens]|uniref:Secreted protein n=1 Tax=Armillaria tabescens TaxID=1929756 RepID=A0AA39TXA9_ARMTA|nr:uncharacterized protein EV420DRAFT_1508766 [Desarmillaria tabescens]KAK0465914.1 hypothetical protein EV420DRAFT_1508766 [Desarmillaria tabescens]
MKTSGLVHGLLAVLFMPCIHSFRWHRYNVPFSERLGFQETKFARRPVSTNKNRTPYAPPGKHNRIRMLPAQCLSKLHGLLLYSQRDG